MLKVIALSSLLVPTVAVTKTLGLSKTTCQHVIHKEITFTTAFDKSESFRNYINYYTPIGSVSVKKADLFWKCHIS